MSARAIRRAAERHALKLARKAGTVSAQTPPTQVTGITGPSPVTAVPSEPTPLENIPEPGLPFPSLFEISPARVAANRANAELSSGPITPEGKAVSSQNHTIHGLARHNGEFKLLSTEDPIAFEAFRQELAAEHQPATPTEAVLVNALAESHWLAKRAQRLQFLFIDPDTGLVNDEKPFSLYLRYETTHQRAFHKALTQLQTLKAGRRKTELGFEAQKAHREAERMAAECHEMKKDRHYWDILRKDGEACQQLSRTTEEYVKAAIGLPGFEAQYASELAKRGLDRGFCSVAVAAKASAAAA